jgi:hypothetical protein
VGGTIWEDGLGNGDVDARALSHGEARLTEDPQVVRYGDGKGARVIVEAAIAGPAHRSRPVVDVMLSEGLRPVYARLTPDQAREVAGLLAAAADAADAGAEGPAPA